MLPAPPLPAYCRDVASEFFQRSKRVAVPNTVLPQPGDSNTIDGHKAEVVRVLYHQHLIHCQWLLREHPSVASCVFLSTREHGVVISK